MIAKATGGTPRSVGLRARFAKRLALLLSPRAAIRARRDAEDAHDVALAREILAKNSPRIPHDEVKRRVGLL